MKQGCLACTFLCKIESYSAKVCILSNVRLNTEPSQDVQSTLTRGGPERTFYSFRLAETPFYWCYCVWCCKKILKLTMMLGNIPSNLYSAKGFTVTAPVHPIVFNNNWRCQPFVYDSFPAQSLHCRCFQNASQLVELLCFSIPLLKFFGNSNEIWRWQKSIWLHWNEL